MATKLEKVIYTAHAHTTGGREGRSVSDDGLLDVKLAPPKELGGMGGAQPLAATLAGACSLNIECQQSSIDFRLRTRYVDKQAKDLDDALALIAHHTARKEAVSIALCGNAADVLPELVKRVGNAVPLRVEQRDAVISTFALVIRATMGRR